LDCSRYARTERDNSGCCERPEQRWNGRPRIKLYGTSKSRANRCLWALEELGLDYEHIPVNFGEESHRPAYLAINPNGRVPALDDNGVILWESIAINLYLADKYGTAPLCPHNPELRGKCYQWSLWAVNEIEPRVYTLMAHRVWKPPGQRDQTAVRRAIEELIEPFRILNDTLKGGSYLVGGAFSIADLNVASISRALKLTHNLDLSQTPPVEDWLKRCLGRKAYQRVLAMK